MIVKVTTPATSHRLTTLDNVKTALDINSSDDDTYLEMLIDQASDFVSQYCARTFAKQTYEEQLGGTGHPRLMLDRTPIQQINEIKSGDAVLDSNSYEIEDADAGFVWIDDKRWRQLRYVNQGIVPTATRFKRLDYTVEYEAGYTLPDDPNRDLPASLEAVVIEIVKWWFSERTENPNVRWQEVGDTRETKYDRQVGDRVLPPKVETSLKPFVRVDT